MPKPWLAKAKELLAESLKLPKTEQNEIDWKLALSENKKRLTQHLCAFANYPGGGYLAYGVSNGGVVGAFDDETATSVVTQLANLGRDAVEPKIQIDHGCEEYEGVRLLFIRIPESPIKPVHLRSQGVEETFIRSGGTTREASRQEVGALMLNSRNPRWEELSASVQLSDIEILAKLDVGPVFEMLKKQPMTTRDEMMAWLEGKKFMMRSPDGGGVITNLGAVTAAVSLADFEAIGRHAVRVVQYQGSNKSKAKGERVGNRGYAVGFQNLLNHVMRILPKSEVIEAALRTTKPIYPEIALREIIANALIHQDFSITGSGPLIEIFDDRIEVSSPGGLLPTQKVDRLIGAQPASRNERLASTFRLLRICEERGQGLVNAAFEAEMYGLPPIELTPGDGFFKVTIHSPRTFAQMSEAERMRACYQHAVLKHCSRSVMTNKSLRERLKMPEKHRSMVSVLISEAITAGLIKAADADNKSKKFTEYLPYWA